MFPNAGDECEVLGCVLGFHGDAVTLRWEVVSNQDTTCELRTGVGLPLVLTRRMTLCAERPALLIEESVRNEGAVAVPFLWGHHPAFPAITGARIDLPTGIRIDAEPRAAADYSDVNGLCLSYPTGSCPAGNSTQCPAPGSSACCMSPASTGAGRRCDSPAACPASE